MQMKSFRYFVLEAVLISSFINTTTTLEDFDRHLSNILSRHYWSRSNHLSFLIYTSLFATTTVMLFSLLRMIEYLQSKSYTVSVRHFNSFVNSYPYILDTQALNFCGAPSSFSPIHSSITKVIL